MTNKIPCPVAGCDEVFEDEAAAIAHMKAEHLEEFTSHTGELGEQLKVNVSPGVQDVDAALAMVPPELMKEIEARMDARIGAALEAFMPQVQAAVKGSIEQVIAQAKAAGVSIPGVTGNPTGPPGGVVDGSPVTPAGAELIKAIFGGGGGTDIEGFIRQANQYKALGDLFNPGPSITDRIMQTAYIRNLKNLGLVTDKSMKAVEKELLGEVESDG